MNKVKTKIKILDCTLRDGGYYNKWDFDEKLISKYLKSLSAASIDFIELGFRSIPKNEFMGPFKYSTDDYINSLGLPYGPKYAVMINASDFLDENNLIDSSINLLFQNKVNSPIEMVRIAINFDQAEKARTLTEKLKKMGYKIGFNLMQAHNKTPKTYQRISESISLWETVDVLYFADSLGNMNPTDVKKICKSLSQGWKGDLGIHTHNNKNMALINSLVAIENGVTFCDSTINGMGRGAGNVTTESILLELNKLQLHDGNLKMIQATVEDFNNLKKEYDWGANLYYHFAANNNIHPSYVQTLKDDKRYSNEQVFEALCFLAKQDSTSFSPQSMKKAVFGDKKSLVGRWNATDWMKDREVLLIGAGKSVEKYKNGILYYIEKYNPNVIFLNINQYLPNTLAKATIVCHEERVLFDSQQYSDLPHPIILPKGRLGDKVDYNKLNQKILDYGLILNERSFEISSNSCELGWSIAAAYALAVITMSGANKINLVGFDGYGSNDPRHEEMNDIFRKYSSLEISISITSLTPTSYAINQGSIYSPLNK
jgi:4-hydroxy 2-oxovalerate aldolase